jgi:hypothetical protein
MCNWYIVMQTTVYKIVLMNGGAAEYETVLKEYTSTDDNQVGHFSTLLTVITALLPHRSFSMMVI